MMNVLLTSELEALFLFLLYSISLQLESPRALRIESHCAYMLVSGGDVW